MVVAHSRISFENGSLDAAELVAAFSALPLDLTFIDADGIVRYFSEFRIFSRPESCLDTHVLDCHSPGTRPRIERMISEFASGWRDDARFLEQKQGRPVDVRYLAVRDPEGAYLGCLEVAAWADEPGAAV
jgi:DUF438 domain-containing protein